MLELAVCFIDFIKNTSNVPLQSTTITLKTYSGAIVVPEDTFSINYHSKYNEMS